METIDFIPLVKAYPALSRKYGEVSCVAGVEITAAEPHWIRLYPVPFRSLDDDQQFRKYQPVRLAVEAHRGDLRPETRRPDRDSIALRGGPVSSRNAWALRRRFVEPLMVSSMCEITRRQRNDGTSLGVFRPGRVLEFKIEKASVNEAKRQIAKAWSAQTSLLDGLGSDERTSQLRELEQVPWTFRYRYGCGEAGCRGHSQSIIDWEIAQFYRRVRHFDDWQDRMSKRWLSEVCGADRDTAFFVGNMHQHPRSFLILGVWWPTASRAACTS
ncbi:MAG TPA: hypothetical protein VIH71_12460 [Solirubrobacteraceae bacterium]